MPADLASLVKVNRDDTEDPASRGDPDGPAPEGTDRSADSIARLADSPAIRAAINLANSPAFRATTEAARRQQQLARDVTNSPAFRAAAESAGHRQQLIRDLAESPTMRAAINLANSPAVKLTAQASATWQKYAELGAGIAKQAGDAIRSAIAQIWPEIAKAIKTAGEVLDQIYRAAAPPNWTANGSARLLSYLDAVNLAREEGIPIAWVPDPETVHLLMAVPKDASGRTSALRRILEERTDTILDYCQDQLNQITDDPGAPEHHRQMAEVALQSIQALRANLPAPAQSAAANLTDQLLRRLFTPIDGRYVYKKTSGRVADLSSYVAAFSLSFLAILRELATLMPVPKALAEWWPDQGMELPEAFSRHATAHAIAEPAQVNTINALTAIMLAVSLLCQEAASDWTALRTFAWDSAPELSDEKESR
jgi:hypothetical protein